MEISIAEAQAQLPALADRVRSGGAVVITKDGQPYIKLVACEPPAPEGGPKPRRLDLLVGEFQISDEAIDELFLQPAAKGDEANLFHDGRAG